MATSVLMADRQTTNPNGQLPFPGQDHVRDQNHLPIRRSSGRRRKPKGEPSSSLAAGQQKKTPQRGMGVEKLERLRVQQENGGITEINHRSLADPTNLMMNNSSSSSSLPVHQFSKLPQINQNHTACLGFHGQMGFPNSALQFGINDWCLHQSDFLGKNVAAGFSKELSSTPDSANCYYQHCNACRKKKKVNGDKLELVTFKQICKVDDCGLLGLSIIDNRNIIKEETQGLAKKIPLVGYGRKQGVEVVAVHRKGREGGRVVMEYEFFPSSEKGDSQNDEWIKSESSSSSSTTTTMAGFDASNYIDLSLKLSY